MMQNNKLCNNVNQNDIRLQQNQESIKSWYTKEDRKQSDIKQLSLSQNQDKKWQKKIKIISETELYPKKQLYQTNELNNNTQESQQQVVQYQDSNQKNTQQQYSEEKFLTQRIDITTLNFENSLTETITLTQNYSCFHCLSSLSFNNITLPCFHFYHQECFQELVNIFLNEGYSQFFQCRCKISTPYKTLIKLISNDKKIIDELVIQQQAWLIFNAPSTIQNQIPGKNRNISNIKQFIREQITNYKASLKKK